MCITSSSSSSSGGVADSDSEDGGDGEGSWREQAGEAGEGEREAERCGEVQGVAGVVWAVCGELARVRGLGVLRWGGLLPLLGHLRPREMAAVMGRLGQVGGSV